MPITPIAVNSIVQDFHAQPTVAAPQNSPQHEKGLLIGPPVVYHNQGETGGLPLGHYRQGETGGPPLGHYRQGENGLIGPPTDDRSTVPSQAPPSSASPLESPNMDVVG